MIIPYNKNITKVLNNYNIGITIILQCLLQSTKHVLRVDKNIKIILNSIQLR